MINIYSSQEIKILQQGGKRLAEIINAVCEKVASGVSTLELEILARTLIEKNGDKPSFLGYTPSGAKRPYPAATCISINEEIIHGIPNERPKILKEGDIVTIDIGLIHEKLCTDSARTVGVGALDQISRELLKATARALENGIKAARRGRHVGDIGYAIETFVEKTPFSIAEDLCGHGVGKNVHEDPYVPNRGRKGDGPLLKEGMVLAIEPMLNAGTAKVVLAEDGYTYRTADGKRSAHFEHTIAITTGEPLILTE
ncbi:MAG TPA: type I methionyl aminopeptidase [Candidatus Paceibacterota bacterium]